MPGATTGTMMPEPLTIEPVAPHLLRSLREHVHERLRRAISARSASLRRLAAIWVMTLSSAARPNAISSA